ncbi:MAG: Lrp/AsnC family transcriptional regulator [Methanomassiliicoccales archaeon]|nr:MAG: Lrp/AsnC family transcriptional regulator [Methanomassiliicoccales archaeon]
MDERDIDILKRLISNSRTPFREIADGLGLSVNGVYKRIKNLTDSGVIRDFQTTLDTRILNAIPIMVFGQCEAKSVEKVANLLGKNPHTNKILVAGGNYLYITAVFRNLRELQPYIETVKKKGYIPAPRVGLINIKRSEFWRIPRKPADLRLEDLSSLDFKIISALHRDSRRSAKDTSQELGVSTKTVRKGLSKLANKGYIQMNVLLAFDSSRDIFAILHLNLKKGQTANKVEALLINNHSKNILSIHTFSNLPNQILCSTWTNTMKEIKDIQNDLQKRGILESIVPNIFYTTYIYESWVDTLIDDLAKNPKMIQDFKKKSARGTRRIKADLVDMDTLGVIDTYRKALAQALDDGVITDDEEAILTSLRDSLNISDEQHNKILEFVKSRGALNKIEVDLYSKVLDQALEDSVITEDEEAILLSLRDSLSITDEMHKKLIEGKKKGK